MYSVYDDQTGRWLATGRNSSTFLECLKQLWEFAIDGEDMDDLDKLPIDEKVEYLETFMDFRIEEHGDEWITEEHY